MDKPEFVKPTNTEKKETSSVPALMLFMSQMGMFVLNSFWDLSLPWWQLWFPTLIVLLVVLLGIIMGVVFYAVHKSK